MSRCKSCLKWVGKRIFICVKQLQIKLELVFTFFTWPVCLRWANWYFTKVKEGSADIGASNNKQLLPRVKCLLQLSKKKIHHFLQTENRKHTIWQKNQPLEVLARPTFLPLLRSIKTSNFFTFKKDRKKNKFFAKTHLMPNILDLTPLDFQRKNSSVPNISDNLWERPNIFWKGCLVGTFYFINLFELWTNTKGFRFCQSQLETFLPWEQQTERTSSTRIKDITFESLPDPNCVWSKSIAGPKGEPFSP